MFDPGDLLSGGPEARRSVSPPTRRRVRQPITSSAVFSLPGSHPPSSTPVHFCFPVRGVVPYDGDPEVLVGTIKSCGRMRLLVISMTLRTWNPMSPMSIE